jgi:hypothetical protein
MQQMQEPPEQVAAVRSRRRPPRKRSPVLPTAWNLEDLEAVLASHEEALAGRIEQGIRSLQDTADRLVEELVPEGVVSPEDTARGILAHVDERYQALTMRIERLEGALRQLVQTLKRMRAPGGKGADALARRIDELAASVQEATSRQRDDLVAFTKRTGEGLAQVASRAGQGLARVAQQHETLLDEKLEQMLEAIESLNFGPPSPQPTGPPATNGATEAAQKASSMFTERLRVAEDRLARISGDLSGWDPFAAPPQDEPPAEP